MKVKFKSIKGFKVNPIGVGTWTMGGGWYPEAKVPYADYKNDSKEIEAIQYSISKGQNHIDGAELYGAGHTDELIGQAIRDFERKSLFISSKIHRTHALKEAIVPATKDILRRMNTDYLDLLYIHSPFPEIPMSEYIYGLNQAVELGLAKNIGVSNFNLDQLKEAIKLSQHPIAANQIRYNILYKTDATEELLKFCRDNDIIVVAYRPVERKLLTDNLENKEVLDIANKYNKTPAQIAINWLITQDNIVTIPKASEKYHIDENLIALDFKLNSDDWQTLDRIESIQ